MPRTRLQLWLAERIAARYPTAAQFAAAMRVSNGILAGWLHGGAIPEPYRVSDIARLLGAGEQEVRDLWWDAQVRKRRTMRRRMARRRKAKTQIQQPI